MKLSYFFPKYTNKYEMNTTRKAAATSSHFLVFGLSTIPHFLFQRPLTYEMNLLAHYPRDGDHSRPAVL
jgi:hypothetical protein